MRRRIRLDRPAHTRFGERLSRLVGQIREPGSLPQQVGHHLTGVVAAVLADPKEMDSPHVRTFRPNERGALLVVCAGHLGDVPGEVLNVAVVRMQPAHLLSNPRSHHKQGGH